MEKFAWMNSCSRKIVSITNATCMRLSVVPRGIFIPCQKAGTGRTVNYFYHDKCMSMRDIHAGKRKPDKECRLLDAGLIPLTGLLAVSGNAPAD
jgi:hypothetical protein